MLSLAVPNVLALPRQLSHLLCVFTPWVRDGWRGREGGRLLGEGVNNTNLHLLMCPLSTLLCLCIFYYDWYFFFLLPLRFFLLPFLFSFIFGLWSFIFIDSWLKKKNRRRMLLTCLAFFMSHWQCQHFAFGTTFGQRCDSWKSHLIICLLNEKLA